VIREYVGAGSVGAWAAALDAEERAARFQRARDWAVVRSRLDAAEDVTDQFCIVAETQVRGALMVAGYHLIIDASEVVQPLVCRRSRGSGGFVNDDFGVFEWTIGNIRAVRELARSVLGPLR
jgi:hypothetical protein